jgi:hypothetical protein
VRVDRSTVIVLTCLIIGLFYFITIEYKRDIQKREDILLEQNEALELQDEAILLLRKQNQILMYYYMNGGTINEPGSYNPQNKKQYTDPI